MSDDEQDKWVELICKAAWWVFCRGAIIVVALRGGDEVKMSERQEKINGMRALCDFLESAPDVPVPFGRLQSEYLLGADVKEQMVKVARAMKTFEKDIDEDNYALVKMFGPIRLRIYTKRKSVCEQVQVGVEEVPKYEWRCPDSLLEMDAAVGATK